MFSILKKIDNDVNSSCKPSTTSSTTSSSSTSSTSSSSTSSSTTSSSTTTSTTTSTTSTSTTTTRPVTRDEALNLLLASIAFEELGLAHLLNAEAEKIQSVLGTLKGQAVKKPSLTELLRINSTVDRILKDIISKEMLLLFKLQAIVDEINRT